MRIHFFIAPFYLSESEDSGEETLAMAFSGFTSPFCAFGVCVSDFVRLIGPIFIHIYQECANPLAAFTETKLSFAGGARNRERFFFHFQKRGGQSFSGRLGSLVHGAGFRFTTDEVRKHHEEHSLFLIV